MRVQRHDTLARSSAKAPPPLHPLVSRELQAKTLAAVLERVATTAKAGGRPLVQIDLDLTALMPVDRTTTALRAAAKRWGVPELANASPLPGYTDGGWATFLASTGLEKKYPSVDWAELYREFRAAYRAGYAGPQVDQVTPGLADFVKKVRAAGGEVIFNSGRGQQAEAHTLRTLEASGIEKPKLVIGADPTRDGGQTKALRQAELDALGTTVAVIDDRERNRDALGAVTQGVLFVAIAVPGFTAEAPTASAKHRISTFETFPVAAVEQTVGFEQAAPKAAVALVSEPGSGPAPWGVFRGVDGRHGRATPRDAIVDGNAVVTIPRRMSPDVHGTRLAADVPVAYPALLAKPDQSVDVEAFYAELETSVPPDVRRRIDETLAEAERLYAKGLAAKPPVDKVIWRRALVQSYLHSRDLTVVMKALGFDKNVTGTHDLEEPVPARDLQWQMQRKEYEPWFDAYVSQLDPDAQVNISFFNPHFAAAMYVWGDAREDANGLMDPHRLSPHHNANSQEDVDWVEKAVNFVQHHLPREHVGIRHVPLGNWGDLEHALATDAAIKDSEIGKAIARDAARVWEMLEREGKVVPWQKLKAPSGISSAKFERSYSVLQGQNALGDRTLFKERAAAAPLLQASTGGVKALGTQLQAELGASGVGAIATLEQLLAAAASGTDADRELAQHLGAALAARFAQLSVPDTVALETYAAGIERVEALLGRAESDFFPKTELADAMAALAELPKAAASSREQNDQSLAATYDEWHRMWKAGFPLQT